MVYSNEAKGYRQQFTDYVRENYVVDVAQFVSGHTERSVYALDMVFTFPTVINKGWAKKKAKTLYKRFDVGNRRKLLEDCLVEVLGEIDDSLFFEVRMVKLMGDPGVVLTVTEVSPSEYGIPYVRRNK
jgi:Holliday junction resolvase RusA-like endonuclease